MTAFDPSKALRQSNAAQLSKMIELDPAAPDPWTPRDLPAMLRHQLTAPLEFDLGIMKLPGRAAADRKHALAGAAAAGVKSFEDLLFGKDPLLELLKLSKEFFKWRTQVCIKSSPEWKVAYLFYLLSILVAGDRAHTLTTLTAADLLSGTGWALKQGWVDERTKELIRSARKRLLT
jgi:hypothetical protein